MMYLDSFFGNVLDSFFDDTFDSAFGSSFKAPKLIKSMTDNSFPQSNVFINKKTKEQKITVCLPGISKKECSLSSDDNVLTLKISKENEKNDDWTEIQNAFSTPEKATISWKIDTSKYDLDTLKVDFEDGLLTILIEPTEVAKPKKRLFFGDLNEKSIEDKKE